MTRNSRTRRPTPAPPVSVPFGRAAPAVQPREPLAPPPDFLDAAAALGIEFEPRDLPQLGRYLATLLTFNDTVNLTAITDPAQAWKRHILDSLTLLPALADLPEDARVIDVGSGGGLPGVPLAICLPHVHFTLLEATKKKAEFLTTVCGPEHLRLANVDVVARRAENAAHDRGERAGPGAERSGGHREHYDAAIARAVGRLATLAELTVPFARPGGRILLIKGAQAEQELAEAAEAMRLLHALHARTWPTPTGTVIALEKVSSTPKIYPRADGEPKRAPLGVPRT